MISAPASTALAISSPVPAVVASSGSLPSAPPTSDRPDALAISIPHVPDSRHGIDGSPSGPVTVVRRFGPQGIKRSFAAIGERLDHDLMPLGTGRHRFPELGAVRVPGTCRRSEYVHRPHGALWTMTGVSQPTPTPRVRRVLRAATAPRRAFDDMVGPVEQDRRCLVGRNRDPNRRHATSGEHVETVEGRQVAKVVTDVRTASRSAAHSTTAVPLSRRIGGAPRRSAWPGAPRHGSLRHVVTRPASVPAVRDRCGSGP